MNRDDQQKLEEEKDKEVKGSQKQELNQDRDQEQSDDKEQYRDTLPYLIAYIR